MLFCLFYRMWQWFTILLDVPLKQIEQLAFTCSTQSAWCSSMVQYWVVHTAHYAGRAMNVSSVVTAETWYL